MNQEQGQGSSTIIAEDVCNSVEEVLAMARENLRLVNKVMAVPSFTLLLKARVIKIEEAIKVVKDSESNWLGYELEEPTKPDEGVIKIKVNIHQPECRFEHLATFEHKTGSPGISEMYYSQRIVPNSIVEFLKKGTLAFRALASIGFRE